MPITRAKARSLLNQKEMELYDDSRINGLRQLDARALASRVKRARTARDRARDLVQKHKLASRAQTGSKRGASGQANQRSKDKAALMADILQRFERQLRDVEREAGKTTAAARRPARKTTTTTRAKAAGPKAAGKAAPAGRAAPAKGAAKKAATKKAAAKKAAGKKAVRKTAGASTGKRATPAKKTATGTRAAPAKTSSAAKSTRKRTAGKATRKRHITAKQALAQTQALLEAKQAQDAAPKPWQDLPTDAAGSDSQPGYQSNAAKRRALRLHAAEARIPAIQGSVSTRDRINQGKRDHRGGENGE